MTINTNMIKGLGLILIAGAGGGWIAQKIANRKYEAKVKKYDEKVEELRKKIESDISVMKSEARSTMGEEARSIIQNAIDGEARKALSTEVSARVNQLNLDSFAESAAEKSMEKAISRAQEKLYGEAKDQLKNTIELLAKNTVESRLKDEMYQVNSRRIIEDSVDRAVREEVHNTVKKKLKWVDFNNMSDLKALIF